MRWWWAGCFARELPLLTVKAPGVLARVRGEVLVRFLFGKIAGLPPSVRSVSYDDRLERVRTAWLRACLKSGRSTVRSCP
jgi:hypothetical protein